MPALTIRLPDRLVSEVEVMAKKLQISRSQYIRKSIQAMNKGLYEEEKRAKLIEASKQVRKESMRINSEFSKVEYDPET